MKKTNFITISILIIVSLILCGCDWQNVDSQQYLNNNIDPSQLDYTIDNAQNLSVNNSKIPQVVKKVSPSVVGINVLYDNAKDDATGSLGSGVVVEKNGYILTNYHVVGNIGTIQVVFYDGTTYTADLLWKDKNLDLAILKVEGEFIPIKTGASDEAQVGDTVIAIGTPLAMKFQHTVTAGIISALNRTLTIPSDDGISFMEDLIQTDASINPGNSGGPLINMKGEVIGINTLKVTDAEGLGFAIPIDICIPIIENVIKDPNYKAPYLGIMAMDKEIATYLGRELDNGIMVMSIDPTSPAYESGLREDCIILEVNSTPVNTVFELRKLIYSLGANSTIDILYLKENKRYRTSCTLTMQ